MTISKNLFINYFFPLLFVAIGLLVSMFFSGEARFLILTVTSIAFLLWAIFCYPSGNIARIIIIFIGFHILYGLSGPFSILYTDYSRGVISFLDEYLLAYSIATLALIVVLFLSPKSSRSPETKIAISPKILSIKNLLTRFAFLFLILSLIFGFINFIRVNGFELLQLGKGFYQTAVSDLPLTLPSEETCYLSIALFFLALSQHKPARHKSRILIPYFVLLSPLIALWLSIGYRGPIFTVMIIGVVAFFYTTKLKFSPKWILIIFLVYLFSVFLFSARAHIPSLLIEKNPKIFFERTFVAMKYYVLPGASEFGAPYVNFTTYLNNPEPSLYLGKTYYNDLLVAIPSWFYPGEKPQQITNEFRYKYFGHEISQGGRVAGPGFSSILEAYINFSFLGVFFVYFLAGFFLLLLEKLRSHYKKFWFVLFYILLLPYIIYFHRTSFGLIWSGMVLNIFLILIVLFAMGAFRSIHFKKQDSSFNHRMFTDH